MPNNYRLRSICVFILICGAFAFLSYRLYSIQISRHKEYKEIQRSQFYYKEETAPRAGIVFDRKGKILALSKKVDSVYANPKVLKANSAPVKKVSAILKITEDALNDILQKGFNARKSFVWLKRRVSDEESSALRSQKIKGLGLQEEYKRCYPNGTLACHLIGFRGVDETALGGVESTYDSYLKGAKGERYVPRDAKAGKVVTLEMIEKPPLPGKNVYLTIDTVIQFIAEEELDNACKKWKPASAQVIVLKTSTAEVLAMANRPVFDPNQPSNYPPETYRNLCITDFWESGSVFKPFIASSLLLRHLADPDELIFCENGKYKMGRRILNDHKPHGNLSFRDVIALSSNIGMAKLGMRMSKSEMFHYVKLFGFGTPSGVGLPAEATGIITPFEKWNDYTMASVPMGHEIAVTSMQLIKAFNVFANGGKLVNPTILSKIADKDGNIASEPNNNKSYQILDAETEKEMRLILRKVVETGTAPEANIKEYTIGGKTGTAQKMNTDGTYSHNKFRAVFVGFAPVEKPEIIVLVMLDEPRGSYYGGVVAAPVVANIIRKTLKYLGAPSRMNIATTE
jgi:cell division protein FtsI (penicillin-binding protein 3)